MSRQLIDMAREAGLIQYVGGDSEWHSARCDSVLPEDLARLAALIRADEREKCAVKCANYLSLAAESKRFTCEAIIIGAPAYIRAGSE